MGKAVTKLLVVNDYVVLDVETTGLDTKACEIIEIAALRVRGGIVTDRYESLVKPASFPIPAFIERLTGISNDMLTDAPFIDEIMPSFREFVGDSVVVGHNVCFDARFVNAATGPWMSNNLVDTMRIARLVYEELESHRLPTVFEQCVSEGMEQIHGFWHRAVYDTLATQAVYEHMKGKLVAKYGDDPEASWKARKKPNKHRSKTKKGDVLQTVDEIDESNPFYGTHVCFTGRLSTMTRVEAWQRLVNLGGVIEEGAVQNLDYLVVGNAGFNSSSKGKKSSKIVTAERNQERGLPVQIISEDFFMEFAKDALG